MSFRSWLSVITLVLIAVVLFFSRHELMHAWHLLERVNIPLLLLLIPLQILVYYSAGEMMFSYLRAKGDVTKVSHWKLARMAFELNFVNHILPSGGVSGVGYMNWRLAGLGIKAGRATMAQVVRYVMGFLAFVTLVVIAMVALVLDGKVNRWVTLASVFLVLSICALLWLGAAVLRTKQRAHRFASWATHTVNAVVRGVTFGKVGHIITVDTMTVFVDDLHDDYIELMKDKRILVRPYLWGLVYTAADAALFLVAFWALGITVNFAPIVIAYGLAAVAGFFVVTPGGAGAYEALMIGFLALAGVARGSAIAGVLLARVILLVGTIVFGYIFYQQTIWKYAKSGTPLKRQ